MSTLALQGKTLAETNCSSCHATGPTGQSSHAEAPAFAMLVNEKGADADTLSAWLRSAHNYPEEMQFYLRDPEIKTLVAYMLSLKRAGSEPSLEQIEATSRDRRSPARP
ncbi:MAG: c-type cytochrome [Parvibaculum sp.]